MSETQQNTIAIAEVAILLKQLTKDVDKVVLHLEEVPVVRVISLEKRISIIERACAKRSWLAFTTMMTILGLFMYKHFWG